MENLDKKTTKQLIDIIITKVGLPLPTYDYNDYQKFIAVYPKNISTGNGVTGIEEADMFDTFKEACVSIVQWAQDNECIG